ncbi:MAG TPA: 30S ribosomal protein S19 [Thermoplasmata archaeon]|nr:30S ribosomal protein S19 [Thermoplasmata archaeon]
MPKSRRGKKVEVRRKREFTLRGHTLEQLRSLPLEELAKLLSARARRSIRRGFTVETQRFLEAMAARVGDKPVRTHTRDALILPNHVGRKVSVYNGHEFRDVEVRPEMIGHYYGEFSLTRKFEKHSGPGVGATRSSKYMPLK